MTRQETLDALVAERFGKPVREVRCWNGRAPAAELLDVLKLDDAQADLDVREAAS